MDPHTDFSSNYTLPQGSKKTLLPTSKSPKAEGATEAVELIRQKIDDLYQHEPNAKQELAEAEIVRPRSRHQQFMYDLSHSGRPLAEIQTAWHEYYINLPDDQKHEVWQEFYKTYEYAKNGSHQTQTTLSSTNQPEVVANTLSARPQANTDSRSVADIKQQLTRKIATRSKRRKKKGSSLLFGLATGAVTLVILSFGFFNERFLAPFMTPSRNVSSAPLIIDPSSTVADSEPKIIIPKINVEIPVVYTEPSIEEERVQKALESGVLHYATTPGPGEVGNGVIFGHSSNNILNKGKYKFAFVLLKRLEAGDTFILQKDGKRYVYRVYEKKIVKPEDVSVLTRNDKPASFSLITCDPPGTSINRLVVTGEQISPDSASNVASKVNPTTAAKPQVLPSDSPSLWSRFTGWLSS